MMGNSNVPKLTLNIYYVTAEDTLFLKNIRSSDETCCKYEFITIKSDNSKIEVYSMNPVGEKTIEIYDNKEQIIEAKKFTVK